MFKKLFLVLLIMITVEAKYIRYDSKKIVIDTSTSLMWQDDTFPYNNWKGAVKYCDNLVLAHFDDWYLPNINELFSIVDLTHVNTAINNTFKGETTSSDIYILSKNQFWSSTNIHSSDKVNRAFYVDFSLGTIESNQVIKNTIAVRCVRHIFQ